MPLLPSPQDTRPLTAPVAPAGYAALDRGQLEEGAERSPAVALRKLLVDDLEAGHELAAQAREPGWSPRSTILFSGGVALLLWAAIAYAVMS